MGFIAVTAHDDAAMAAAMAAARAFLLQEKL